MTITELRESVKTGAPPRGLSGLLLALWHDAAGDWKKAHAIVQEDQSPTAAWIHAYLHRKEGDTSNARYWYSRANKETSHVSLEEEWDALVSTLLSIR